VTFITSDLPQRGRVMGAGSGPEARAGRVDTERLNSSTNIESRHNPLRRQEASADCVGIVVARKRAARGANEPIFPQSRLYVHLIVD
jgi:hypothetical protein